MRRPLTRANEQVQALQRGLAQYLAVHLVAAGGQRRQHGQPAQLGLLQRAEAGEEAQPQLQKVDEGGLVAAGGVLQGRTDKRMGAGGGPNQLGKASNGCPCSHV